MSVKVLSFEEAEEESCLPNNIIHVLGCSFLCTEKEITKVATSLLVIKFELDAY